MATREELLIVARLKDEARRPTKELKQEFQSLEKELRGVDKLSTQHISTLRKLGAETKRNEREQRKLAQSYRDVGDRLTRWLTLPIVAVYGAATLAASNLNEQVSRSDVVFRRNATAIQSWASGAAESMGLSTRAALENAAGFGNMFTQMGIGLDQATSMSQRLVELSSDIASFANVAGGAATVNETFSAAFRGEYDSVQRFIPTIRAATVEQHALAMGLASSKGELTDQAKALATYDLLIQGAGAAVGDFERTQNSAANRMRQAQAEIENAGAAIGQDLLPLLAQAAHYVAILAGFIGDLPGPARTAVAVLLGIAAVAGPIIRIIGLWKKLHLWITTSTTAERIFSAETSGRLSPALAVAGRGLLALIAGMAAIQHFGNQRAQHSRGFVDDLLGDNSLTTLEDHREALRTLQFELTRLERQEGRGRLFSTPWFNAFATSGDADRQDRIDRLRERIDELHDSEGALESQERQLQEAVSGTTGVVSESKAEWDRLQTAINDTRDTYDQFVGRFADLESQRLSQRQAITEMRSRLAGGDMVTIDDQLTFALQQLDAIQSIVEAEQRAGEVAEGPTAAFQRQQELVNDLLRSFPFLADEFDPFLQRLRQGAEYTDSMARNTAAAAAVSAISGAFPSPWGDTARPMSSAATGGSTLAAWRQIDSMVPGRRQISSFTRTHDLGSPDSDHHPSRARAVDIIGANLPATAAMVRRLGGFAELHGTGAGRHLHVVPPAAPPAGAGGPSRHEEWHVSVPVSIAETGAQIERSVRRAIRQARRSEAEVTWN